MEKAEKIIEKSLRKLIKKLLGEIHAPKPYDWQIRTGEMFNHFSNVFQYAEMGQLEKSEQIMDEVKKLALDPNIKKKELLQLVYIIVDHIKREDLLDFYCECRYGTLNLVTSRWINKIAIKYKAVRRKNARDVKYKLTGRRVRRRTQE